MYTWEKLALQIKYLFNFWNFLNKMSLKTSISYLYIPEIALQKNTNHKTTKKFTF